MDLGTLMFSIDGDNSQFTKKIEDMTQTALADAKKIQDAFSFNTKDSNINKNINETTKSTQNLSEKMNEAGASMTNSMGKGSTEVNKLKRAISELENLYNNLPNKEGKVGLQLSDNIEKLRAQIRALSSESKNIGGGISGENSLFSQKSNLSSMRSQYERMSDTQRGSSEGLQLANNIRNTTQQINEEYKKLSPNIERATKSLSGHHGMLDYVARRAIAYVSIWQSTALIKNLIDITGEFEKQKVALEGMLQNTAAADNLFEQIKSFAVVSPFNFKDLISQAKQLAAYSIPSQNIFDELKKLGDVAAGTGSDMSRLILAYGEINTQTVLNGRVLRQFTQAGVPLVDELAKHFTKLKGEVVTTGDVFEMTSKKQVSFQDVDEVLTKMTSKSGMFYQMQERQADTLAGKVSNLKDKWDIMLSAIGEGGGKGILTGLVDGSAAMMQHWQATLTVINSIVIAFGLYKAAMITAGIIAKQNLGTELQELAVQKAKTVSSAALAATGGTAMATGIGAGLAVLTLLIGAYQSYQADQKARTDKIFEEINAVDQEALENNKLIDRLKELSSASSSNASAMQERKDILDKLSQTEPRLSNEISNHADKINELTKAQELYNETQEVKKTFKFSISQEGGLKEAEQGLTEAKNSQRNAVSEMEIAYSKLYNTVKSYKSAGIKNFGIEKIDDNVLESINKILDGSGKLSDKLQKIRELGLTSTSMDKLFSGTNTLGSLQNYTNTSSDVSKKQAVFNEELHKSASLIYNLSKEHNINVRTEQGRAAIAGIIQDDKGLQEETRKELVQYIHLKWYNGDPYKLLSGWRKDLQDYLGKSNIIIKFDDNLSDVIKGIQQQDKTLRENMAQRKPILIKFGIKNVTDTTSLESAKARLNLIPEAMRTPQQRVQLAAIESQLDDQKNLNKMLGAQQKFGLPIEKEPLKPKKPTAPKDDPIINNLKVEETAIKNVRSEYEKLVKEESSEAAIAQLKKQGAFKGGVTASILPIGEDKGYEMWLESAIKRAHKNIGNKKYNQTFIKGYLNELNKNLQDARIDILVNSIEYKMKDIEDELSTYKPQWNLYKQLLGITGDKKTSLQIAFGDVNAKTLIEYQKEEINKALSASKSKITLDQLLEMSPSDIKKNKINDSIVSMVKELQNTMAEENSTNITSLSNIVETYGTMEDKIQTVRNKNNLLRDELDKSTGFTLPQKEAISMAISQKDKKEVQDLQKTAFELNPIYQKLFSDISTMSNSSLRKLVQQSREFIKNLKEIRDPKTGNIEYQYDTGKKDKNGNDIMSTISVESYTSLMKQFGVVEKDMYKADPFAKIIAGFKKIKDASKDATTELKKSDSSDGLKMIVDGISEVASQASSTASALGGMFDSLGNQDAADAMATISGVASGIGNIANGIASKNPAQVIQGVAGAVSSLAQAHDKKLNKAIEASKQKVKELQNEYTDLERIIKRQLGAQTTEQSNNLLSNYKAQLSELNGQLSDQESKKKKDKAAIADTQEQIKVLGDKIKYFYEDLAKEQYSIDIKDWASQIADSLVGAFAAGSNAAAAFDDTVASIMKNVVKSLISVNVIQPAMENLRKYLFGDGKTSGVFSDSNLSADDLKGMIPYMQSMSSTINSAQTLWDGINNAAASAGIKLSGNTSSTGITASEQSLTENTGNILAGYINNIRLDVAEQNIKIEEIIIFHRNNSVSFSAMLVELKAITANTAEISKNTAYSKMLYEFVQYKLCVSGSGTKINI